MYTSQQSDLLKQTLRDLLVQKKLRNPRYSIRALGRDLSIAPGSISRILRSEMPINRTIAAKILAGSGLAPGVKAGLLKGLKQRSPNGTRIEGVPSKVLKEAELMLVSSWYCYATLALAEIPDFKCTAPAVSKSIGITLDEATMAILRLEQLGLLTRERDGSFRYSGLSIRTSTQIPSLAIKRHQIDGAALAIRSIQKDPVEVREIRSVTMAVDPDQLPRAKELILKFQRQLAALMERPKKKRRQVYRLNVQLFPLSNRDFK